MSAPFTHVDPQSLRVIQIGEGENEILGGDDGQCWVATFADATEAARCVTRYITLDLWPVGMRREKKA
jgi:hypothetical protein